MDIFFMAQMLKTKATLLEHLGEDVSIASQIVTTRTAALILSYLIQAAHCSSTRVLGTDSYSSDHAC